jgi:hypothetical protein
MTNSSNLHTCPVRCMNLLATIVLVMDGQFLQLSSDVICSTGVYVPIRINTIRTGC